MSQNSINITQDTVVKMTVKQGLETERSNKTYGKFDTGELAFTRDTKRIFVGDCNMNDSSNLETIGGSIAGNKYLGMIDSKRPLDFENNGLPCHYDNWTLSQEIDGNVEYFKETPPMIKGESIYRKGNRRWSTTSTYNPDTDAYDGDYMYDVYTNSIILFDSRITTDKNKQPTTEEGVLIEEGIEGKRNTIIEDYLEANSDTQDIGKETQPVQTYGEGYVIFRNIKPDNKTIRFVKRGFNPETGKPTEDSEKKIYSHNLLEVFNVPLATFSGSFDTRYFSINGDKVKIKNRLPLNEIVLDETDSLTFPSKITFKDALNDTINFNVITSDAYDRGAGYEFKITKTNNKNFSLQIQPAKPEEELIIRLGEGLVAKSKYNNTTSSFLPVGDDSFSLELISSSVEFSGGYYKDPYYMGYEDDYVYSANDGFLNGELSFKDTYSIAYKLTSNGVKTAKEYIDEYQNQNSSINFLKTPFFLAWTGVIDEENAYTSTFSVNLQCKIANFPHVAKKILYGGIENIVEKANTLKVVGNNTATPQYDTKLTINNYPTSNYEWNLSASDKVSGKQLYNYPLGIKTTDTNCFDAFYNNSFNSFVNFSYDLSTKDGEPVFAIGLNGFKNFQLIEHISSLDTEEEQEKQQEANNNPELEYIPPTDETIVSYDESVSAIQKIYIDSILVFDLEREYINKNIGYYNIVAEDIENISFDNLTGFIITNLSPIFRAQNGDKPVCRTITVYYKVNDKLEVYTKDINPIDNWGSIKLYKFNNNYYFDMPEIDENNIVQEIDNEYLLLKNFNIYQFATNGDKLETNHSLSITDDFINKGINDNGFEEFELKRSAYSSLNVGAIGFLVEWHGFEEILDENNQITGIQETTAPNYIRVYQTPNVTFAKIPKQPSTTGVNSTAKNYRIPHTANSILLEVSNDTNETIYAFTAKSFSNLKTFNNEIEEYNGFWEIAPNGMPRLKAGDSNWALMNAEEKALKNLPPNSREILEVPLVLSPDETKEFFLRFSNITEADKPKFAIRVVGYRV